MIAIIDYGAGNIRSVENAFKYLGQDTVVTADKEVILKADKVVLPGVGAFKDAMDMLNASELTEVVKEETNTGNHISQNALNSVKDIKFLKSVGIP